MVGNIRTKVRAEFQLLHVREDDRVRKDRLYDVPRVSIAFVEVFAASDYEFHGHDTREAYSIHEIFNGARTTLTEVKIKLLDASHVDSIS